MRMLKLRDAWTDAGPGAQLVTNTTRDYQFAIGYIISGYEMGNGLAVQSGAGPDGANSNLVINETDTFINTTGVTMTVTVDEFRFHAGRITDPVTPFTGEGECGQQLHRDGGGHSARRAMCSATTLSPSPRCLCCWRWLPARRSPLLHRLPPGWQRRHRQGCGKLQGRRRRDRRDVRPVEHRDRRARRPSRRVYQRTDFHRNYYFSISLGFGGKEDEDSDARRTAGSWPTSRPSPACPPRQTPITMARATPPSVMQAPTPPIRAAC